ncbi:MULTISPECIES: acetyltransferase [Mesorhizobium]|uniref:Acetyltransferase n=1 Tax=Mesorhizobium denitrificans TaxID=2294114 RepID=A0A371XCY1_9HYPH|nr:MULTISPECIES: acetyltransferase [Mesorhizobium]RFC67086.1 acetyltransferase [Mesorhizobium denitrificans]
MKTRTFALYSAGGFAREIASDLIVSINSRMTDEEIELIFIDDDPSAQGKLVQGNRVVSYGEAKTIPGLKVNIAFAPPALRRRKHEQCEADGLEFFNVFAPTSRIGENVELGSAAIFAHLSTVTSDAKIGKAFHCNIYSYVAHDCIVGDFVTFAPRVSLNGRIKVEDDVYVGSDATFLPGKPEKYLTIGKGAVIGAGAVVTKDVEPGAVVVGNPAKPLNAVARNERQAA